MGIENIIESESLNNGEIHLYLEGMFWKAYQRSAFIFVNQVTSFKITKKYVKLVDENVVSLGFPKDSLVTHFKQEQIEMINKKELIIKGYKFDIQSYQSWLNALPLSMTNLEKLLSMDQYTRDELNKEKRVLDLLRTFKIEKSTPVDCMMFVIKAKGILDGDI